jgi:DNA-binding LytR/AlgR family response regulator
MKDDVLNKTTIRGTLKSAELELHKNSRFLRCHKCYIVNLDFVERVTGHNQNMKIRLSCSETGIPVARSKAEEISKKVKRNKL